jgi:hypothetical protein
VQRTGIHHINPGFLIAVIAQRFEVDRLNQVAVHVEYFDIVVVLTTIHIDHLHQIYLVGLIKGEVDIATPRGVIRRVDQTITISIGEVLGQDKHIALGIGILTRLAGLAAITHTWTAKVFVRRPKICILRGRVVGVEGDDLVRATTATLTTDVDTPLGPLLVQHGAGGYWIAVSIIVEVNRTRYTDTDCWRFGWCIRRR